MILTEAPYGSDRPYNALRLAGALAATEGTELKLFLMCDAVVAAVGGQAPTDQDANLGARLSALVRCGAEVKVCGLCCETRGIHNTKLEAGLGMGSMPELAQWTLDADRVLTF